MTFRPAFARIGRLAGNVWKVFRDTAYGFIADEALTRGASIAYYTVTSLAPILVIVIAVAGLAFGEDAAQGAIVRQISGMMGEPAAATLQTLLRNAHNHQSAGLLASVLGIITLLLSASGVFAEMQGALNVIWKVEPKGITVTGLLRVRAISLGLVAAMGFVLLVSLAVSTAIAALTGALNLLPPFAAAVIRGINVIVSTGLTAVMFAAIYKVLPDRRLEWQDVAVGSVATALLFNLGKYLISVYLGTTSVATSYGAAGSLVVMLIWVYYSAQIFLIGAEFTVAYSRYFGSRKGRRAAHAAAVKQTAVADAAAAADRSTRS
jgi:membrane protein